MQRKGKAKWRSEALKGHLVAASSSVCVCVCVCGPSAPLTACWSGEHPSDINGRSYINHKLSNHKPPPQSKEHFSSSVFKLVLESLIALRHLQQEHSCGGLFKNPKAFTEWGHPGPLLRCICPLSVAAFGRLQSSSSSEKRSRTATTK